MRRFASIASLLLTACASSQATDVPTIEPISVPPRAEARLQFTPEPGVVPLELGCRAQTRDDGTDSDCDGHLDGGEGGDARLELSLTWRAPAALTLKLEPAVDATPKSECSAEGLCRAYLRADAVPGAPIALAVARDAGDGDAVWASLCASAQGAFLGCYNFSMAPGQRYAVGQLSNP